MNVELKEKLLIIGDEYFNKFKNSPNTYTLDKCYNIMNEYVGALMNCFTENKSLKKNNKLTFILDLIGIENCTEDVVFFLVGLLYRRNDIIKVYSNNPLKDTAYFLSEINKRIIYNTENIDPKRIK